ncbi:MAG: hypothetical protein AAGM84_09835 [Pseudomonadota bacterium]
MSLRLPYVIYVAIGAMLLGALIAPVFGRGEMGTMAPDLSAAAAAHEAMHGERSVSAAAAPAVTLTAMRDPLEGWNLKLETQNFTFTPETAGQDHVAGTGHAHLYVNGVKRARLYGPYAHIPDLPPGTYEISVSLSGNDHAYYVVGGARVAASVTLTQP